MLTALHLEDFPLNIIGAFTVKGPLLVQAILEGRKDVENRKHRCAEGWYAVAMSKTYSADAFRPDPELMVGMKPWSRGMIDARAGHVAGLGLLGKFEDFFGGAAAKDAFGGWDDRSAGRFHHPILDFVELCYPIPRKGQLQVWAVTKSFGVTSSKPCHSTWLTP